MIDRIKGYIRTQEHKEQKDFYSLNKTIEELKMTLF